MRKSIAAVALVAAASMTVAGLAPAAQAADGVTVAKAIVAKYSKGPTSIGNIPVIGKPIPKNKYVIVMTNQTDAAITLNKYQVEAGKLLGWKMEAVQAEATVEGQRKVLQQAIAKKPDGIAVSGLDPLSAYGDLFKLAGQKGIAIVCSACMSKPTGGLVDTHIAGPKMLDLWGQMIAAFTVANVKGTPNVQMFGISVYPILRRFDLASQKNLKRLSPSATFKFNELDFATGVPLQVGNVFSSDAFYHPDPELRPTLQKLGFLAIEMEAAGLYGLASELGVEALAVLTVSDHIAHPEHMTPEQRERGVDDMTRLVLDALMEG